MIGNRVYSTTVKTKQRLVLSQGLLLNQLNCINAKAKSSTSNNENRKNFEHATTAKNIICAKSQQRKRQIPQDD